MRRNWKICVSVLDSNMMETEIWLSVLDSNKMETEICVSVLGSNFKGAWPMWVCCECQSNITINLSWIWRMPVQQCFSADA